MADRPVITKAERRDRTRGALLAVAREQFAERGFEHVGVADLAARAGLTTGAVYHHFGGKRRLFEVVLAEVHTEVAERVAEATTGLAPWDQLVAGCEAFLEASTDPRLQRIMLLDGPAVLGWEAWRELDAATSMRLLEELLAELVRDRTIKRQPVGPIAHLLSGAMNEAALWIARSSDRANDLEATVGALQSMLESLRAK